MSEPSQNPAWFAPAIHTAWRDEDIVILDLRADSYGCLVGAAQTIRPGPEPGAVIVTDPDVRERLLRAGLISTTPTSQLAIIGARSVLAYSPQAPIGPTLLAAVNGLRSTHRFRTSTLPEQVARVRRLNARRLSRRGMAVEDAVSAFFAAQPWLPFAGDCLQRAFMLHAHLAACGIASDWVFGVRTWPFVAHCWIQIGDQVVGDRLERIAALTPILRVA